MVHARADTLFRAGGPLQQGVLVLSKTDLYELEHPPAPLTVVVNLAVADCNDEWGVHLVDRIERP